MGRSPEVDELVEHWRVLEDEFCARYLRIRDLQREIKEGLNVMESSNGANSVIAYTALCRERPFSGLVSSLAADVAETREGADSEALIPYTSLATRAHAQLQIR